MMHGPIYIRFSCTIWAVCSGDVGDEVGTRSLTCVMEVGGWVHGVTAIMYI